MIRPSSTMPSTRAMVTGSRCTEPFLAVERANPMSEALLALMLRAP